MGHPLANRAAAIIGDRIAHQAITQPSEQPAPYLTQALGPRPDNDPTRWDRAAAAIERYRHNTSGIEPDHWIENRSGHDAAIGARPTDPIAAQGWDDVRAVIDHHNAP